MIANIIFSVLFFFVQELLFKYPEKFWYIFCFLIVLLVVFSVIKNRKNYWGVVLPVIYFTSVAIFLLFVPENNSISHLYAAVTSLIGFIVLAVGKTNQKSKYSNFIDIAFSATLFFVYSIVFGLILYTELESWIYLVAASVVNFIVIIVYFYYYQKIRTGIVISATGSLIFFEISWCLLFWPGGIFSRAITALVVIYCLLGMSRHMIKGEVRKKIIFDYLTAALIIVCLVLGTSKWFY